jgi:hypothetical protein
MYTNPMIGLTRNRVEFINEIIVLMMILLQCTLTDFVPSPEIRQNVTGWTVIAMIYSSIMLNITFLMIDVRNSINRLRKIIRYHKVMNRRKNEIAVHNLHVEEIG